MVEGENESEGAFVGEGESAVLFPASLDWSWYQLAGPCSGGSLQGIVGCGPFLNDYQRPVRAGLGFGVPV